MEICKAGRITTQKAECDNLKIVKIDMNLRRRDFLETTLPRCLERCLLVKIDMTLAPHCTANHIRVITGGNT